MISYLLQFFIIILPIISSWILVSHLFKKEHILDKINFIFIYTCCQIVLITHFLSLFKILNPYAYFIAVISVFSITLLYSKKGNIKNYLISDFLHIKQFRDNLLIYMKKIIFMLLLSTQ